MRKLAFRNLTESDYNYIISSVNDWWGGRNMSPMLPRLFFQYFQDTCFAVTSVDEQRIVGFLVGFISQSNKRVGYIHFVGVDPNFRKMGIGEELYRRFFERARNVGCHSVSCVTSPVNKLSITFHQRLGFKILQGDSVSTGDVPVILNYDGPNEDRVRFEKEI